MVKRRSRRSGSDDSQLQAASTRRISSRSNKFSASMKDPTESILDLLGRTSARLPSPTARSRRSTGKRKKKKSSSGSQSSDDSDDSEGSEDSEDSEESEDSGESGETNDSGDSENSEESEEVDTPPRKRRATRVSKASKSSKSPTVRRSRRRVVPEENLSSSDDSESSSEDEDDDGDDDDDDDESSASEEDELKIQRIIACKSETRKTWKELCKNINTSEVDYGSRWFQDDDDEMDENKFEERFLVKWSDLSYVHCSWETQYDLKDQVETAKTHITNFFRKSVNGYLFTADERLDGEYFDPAYIQVDRILEVTNPEESVSSEDRKWGIILDKNHADYESGTGRQFLVKWGNLPYSEITYEFERDLILMDVDYEEQVELSQKRNQKPTKNVMKKSSVAHESERRRVYKIFGDRIKESEAKEANIEQFKKKLEEDIYRSGGQLRDYQAEGVSWLLANYVNKRHSILADEMGLGKTIQTAAFVNALATKFQNRGPYLIIAPLSTIPHWYREFTGWTNLNTIIYHGSAQDREFIREYEIPFECDRPEGGLHPNQRYLKKCHKITAPKWEKTWMAQVVITTPEMMITDDFTELACIFWELLVVDEAHRLKNHSSKLANNLRREDFHFKSTMLLTGTPIQNNMNELWTLMNIIDPIKFEDSETFMDLYGNMKSKENVDDLHEAIRPYILRRLKEDVEKSVPPKEETLIEVELTVLQKQYYRALYEKNVQFLHRNVKKALDGPSINNLAMQLRKCCNHPFLLTGVETDVRKNMGDSSSSQSEAEFLAKASGKLILLDKLLPKLREGGHRVLLFSQFKIMLDILEDYLDLRDFKHERIDGSITGNKRQMAIDRYQAKGSMESSFIMLLSTRAGGVGINLTAADTCIIFDSDWNPQNDLQAQARCHRIGQTKSVKVYRLLARKTYEMQMFHMSSLKMGLDQAVLQGIENGSSGSEGQKNAMTKEEVEKLLRHGAYDIFSEEKTGSSEKESTDFEEQDIDSILARRTTTLVHHNTGSKSNAAGGTFSKASFKASSGEMNAEKDVNDDVDIDDPDFWKKMVGESKVEDKEENLSGKKRARTKANYNLDLFDKELEYELSTPGYGDEEDKDDADFESQSSGESDDEHTLDKGTIEFFPLNTFIPENKQLQQIMDERKRAKDNYEKKHWGGKSLTSWKRADVILILNMLSRYGYDNTTWTDLVTSFMSKSTKKYSEIEVKRLCWALHLVILREAVDEDMMDMARRAKRTARKEQAITDMQESKDLSDCIKKKDELNKNDTLDCASSEKPKVGKKDIEGINHTERSNPTDLMKVDDKKENTDRSVSQDKLDSGDVTESLIWKENQLIRSFTKIWSLYFPLASIALENGVNFAKSFAPRDPATLETGSNKPVNEDLFNTLMIDGFVESVWPALMSRGWKEEVTKEGRKKKRRRQFSHDGKSYPSLVEVLDAAPKLHPELTNIVDGVISTTASKLESKEQKVQPTVPDISPSQINCQLLDRFLLNYAPLQLIADRKRPDKMQLSSKTLDVLLCLHNARSLVKQAKEATNTKVPSSEEYYKLATLFSVHPRASIPHPLWTPFHDAVLISAIAKHGWIDKENRFRNIIDDKDISWGRPFEEVKMTKSNDIPVVAKQKPVKNEFDIDEMKEISQRVATFLNDFEGFVEDPKLFNLNLIVSTYGIVRSINENGVSERWQSDVSLLDSGTRNVPITIDGNNKTEQLPDPNALSDLPTRKALLKRAKAILTKTVLVSASSKHKTNSLNINIPQQPQQYTILDQSNACNIFLAEILRMIIKVGNKKPVKKLTAVSKSEAQLRFQASALKKNGKSDPSKALELKNIADHISFVIRQPKLSTPVKNIIRAILGVEPTRPKKAGESLFPFDSRKTSNTTIVTTSSIEKYQSDKKIRVNKTEEKVNQKESAAGDIAINRALGMAKRKDSSKISRHIGSGNKFPITTIEALLLSVFCSQGIPVLNNDLEALFTTEDIGNNGYTITWFNLGVILEAAAKKWHETAKKKLLRIQKDNKKPEEIAELQIEVAAKKEALIDSMRLHQSPDRLAKKSIMLLEAVRIRMGHTEFQKRKIQKRHEHELGLRPLQWSSKHLSNWATKLEIVQNGRPLANTGADFMTDHRKITPAGYLDKKGCREIFIQISQQTRLRSLFVKYSSREFNVMLSKATKISWGPDGGNAVESSGNYDKILLAGMIRYGFGGFDEMIKQPTSSCLGGADVECLTRKSAQQRLNHLTRELSALDDTNDSIKLLSDRKRNRTHAGLDINSEGLSKVPPSRIQVGINTFFRPPQKDKEVVVLSDDTSSDESAKKKGKRMEFNI